MHFCSQKIKNPNYKGKWKTPWIDNPGERHISDLLPCAVVMPFAYCHVDHVYCLSHNSFMYFS
jgi:hypothetical protein